MVTVSGIGTKLLTIKQAAKILHIHVSTLRRWCNQGIIKSYRIGTRGDRRISADSIDAILARLYKNRGDYHRFLTILFI